MLVESLPVQDKCFRGLRTFTATRQPQVNLGFRVKGVGAERKPVQKGFRVLGVLGF